MNTANFDLSAVDDSSVQPFLFAESAVGQARVEALNGPYFQRSKEQLRIRLYAAFFAVDLMCVACGFMAASALRLGSPFGDQALATLAIVMPTFVAIAIHNGAYSLKALQRPVYGLAKGVIALIYAIAATIGLLFYFKVSIDFSRLVFAGGTVLSVLFVITVRMFAGIQIGRKHGWTFSNHLILVDSVPWNAVHGQPILYTARLGLDVATEDPLLLHQLNHLLANCDRVLVACPIERRRAWTEALRSTAIDVELTVPELNGLGAAALGVQDGHATLLVSSGPLHLRHRMVKRTLDIAVAIVALIALAPLMAVLALAIKLESSGPILFRQLRFGRNNHMFGLLKFRSMRLECTDAAGSRSTCFADERLTRLGKFIRSTSLDELPQLFNVLGGTMSIVGPRPHAVGSTAEDSLFWHIDRRYFDRHAIKPGLTGLAQIRGFRGATLRRDDLTNRLHSDLEYVTGWTVWRDIKIVLATFAVLIHVNAY